MEMPYHRSSFGPFSLRKDIPGIMNIWLYEPQSCLDVVEETEILNPIENWI
jgi:hypothetical protein